MNHPLKFASPLWTAAVALLAGPLAATEITAEAPGTAFTPNEPLVFHATDCNQQPWAYQVTNHLQQPITAGNWESGVELRLDSLVPGYYFLRIPALGAERSFTVLPRDPDAGTTGDASFAMDSAQTWLAGPGTQTTLFPGDGYALTSELERRSGTAMVRSRQRWDVETSPGNYDWGAYGTSMNEEATRGVKVLGMFHDAPLWSKSAPTHILPDDLLALYRFGRNAATFFAPAMSAWEFWNEQDASGMSGWDFAACQKAFYLGVKAANPELPVLIGGIAHTPPNAMNHTAMLNDAGLYFDIYNFHTYKGIGAYPKLVAGIRAFLKQYSLDHKPIWVTENGTNEEGAAEGVSMIPEYRAHSFAQEMLVAEFVVKSQLIMRSLGMARTFTFVLPPYDEMHGAKDWGLLRRDYSAKPGYAAFANLTAQLGRANYVGEVPLEDGVRGFLYRQPDGTYSLAYWSESRIDGTGDGGNREIALPIPDGKYQAASIFGTPTILESAGNQLKLTAQPLVQYLHGLPVIATINPAPLPDWRDDTAGEIDRSIIFRPRLSDDFKIAPNNASVSTVCIPARLTLEVWNLSDRIKTGTVTAEGAAVTGLPPELVLEPWTKQEIALTVDPKIPPDRISADLVFRGQFNQRPTSIATLPIREFRNIIDAGDSRPLPWSAYAGYWRVNSSGQMEITQDEKENAIKIHTVFPSPCDYWLYPEYVLQLPQDSFAGAFAIAYEVKCAPENVGNLSGLVMILSTTGKEVGEAVYLSVTPPTEQWEERIVPFENMDPAEIRMIRIGFNTNAREVTYYLRNIRLLYLQ